MRFQNLNQLAKGINGVSDGTIRGHALAELERAKWRLWNGQAVRGLIGLVHLGQWARARCFEHIPALGKMGRMLLDTIRYLEFNADSMPNYGKRYRRLFSNVLATFSTGILATFSTGIDTGAGPPCSKPPSLPHSLYLPTTSSKVTALSSERIPQ
jgi:hypothetical protein